MVGGVGQVDYHAFDGFDYVALGHIHSSYHVGRKTVRYAGSPLCYHFRETRQPVKGPVLVELNAKGAPVTLETKEIPPLHPMREIRGSYQEIQEAELRNTSQGEYIQIVLTDRKRDPDSYGFFSSLFERRGSLLLELASEYSPFTPVHDALAEQMKEKPVEELFADFYAQRSDGATPDALENELLRFVGEQVRGSSPMDDKEKLEKQVNALLKFAREQENAP